MVKKIDIDRKKEEMETGEKHTERERMGKKRQAITVYGKRGKEIRKNEGEKEQVKVVERGQKENGRW